MRVNKCEIALSTADYYLKQRHICVCSKAATSANVTKMALFGMPQANSIKCNIISYNSSTELNFRVVCEEYLSFLTFIQDAPIPYTGELSFFVYPLFVDFYLELIVQGKLESAKDFYDAYSHLFLNEQGYSEKIEELSKITDEHGIENHSYFKRFREETHMVRMSINCYDYLTNYFQNSEHMALLRMLHKYFNISCHEIEGGAFEFRRTLPLSKKPFCKSPSEATSLSSENNSVLALEQAIQRINEGPPCIPSVYMYSLVNRQKSSLCTAELCSESNLLAGAFEDSSICLWDTTGAQLRSKPQKTDLSRISLGCDYLNDECDERETSSIVKILRGHSGPVYGLSFMPKSDILLSCSEDTTVRAWSRSTHKCASVYVGHCYPVIDVDASPFTSLFASGSYDLSARIWSTERNYPLLMLAGHTSDVNCIKFHPNCSYVATGSYDQTVRLWSVLDGHMVRIFKGHKSTVLSLAFTPNGKLLASAGEDQKIKIWDIGSGKGICELHSHTSAVRNICFSHDSSLLASAGAEHAVKFWDAHNIGNATESSASSKSVDDSTDSPELMKTFSTNDTAVRLVHFGWKGLLSVVGVSDAVEQ